MKYRATIGFCGVPVSMGQGEVRELSHIPEKIISELVMLGYIEPVEEKEAEAAEPIKAETGCQELTGDGSGEALPELTAENAAEEKTAKPVKTKKTRTAK